MIPFAFRKTSARSSRLLRTWCCTLFAALLFCSSAYGQPAQVESDFQVKTDTRSGVLAVRYTVPEGWHCFSTTQSPGGPKKSKIRVTGEGVKVVGDFVPLEAPEEHEVEGFDVLCEEHRGLVVWEAPVEFDAGVDPAKVNLTVKYSGQICMNEPPGACKQVNEKVTARFAGSVERFVGVGGGCQ